MKNLIRLLLLFSFTNITNAQTLLSGKITEQKNEAILAEANIVVYQNDKLISGTSTDLNGLYQIELLPGVYDVMTSYVGLSTLKIVEVIIEENKNTNLDFQLGTTILTPICRIPVKQITVRIIDPDNTTSGAAIIRYENIIGKLPTKNLREMSTMTPGVTFERN